MSSRETSEKAQKVKGKKKAGVSSLYKIEGGRVVRLRPTCERCGPGYFMADHGDRYACGHCGFTWYKRLSQRTGTPLNHRTLTNLKGSDG